MADQILAPAIHTTAYSPTIASVGSTVCRDALIQLNKTRLHYSNSTEPFSVTYDRQGGLGASIVNNVRSPTAIREALLQLFNSAFITGVNQGDTVAYAVVNYFKVPPTYNLKSMFIPFFPSEDVEMTINYSYKSISITPEFDQDPGTLFGEIKSYVMGGEFTIVNGAMVGQGNDLGVQTTNPAYVTSSVNTGPDLPPIQIFGDIANIGYDCDRSDFQVGLRILRTRFNFPVQPLEKYLEAFVTELRFDEHQNRALIHFAEAIVVTLGCMETFNPGPSWILEY